MQAFMHVLATSKKEEDPIKNGKNVLEWPEHFSHYRYMGFFPDTQGQLSPQSVVGSGRISNSSKILWLFSLTARMKKIQSTSSPKDKDRTSESQQVIKIF